MFSGSVIPRSATDSRVGVRRHLSCNRRVVFDVPGQGARELTATCILSFGGQCLVRVVGAPDWHMRQLTEDGSTCCWGRYGTELGEAIDGL